MQGPTKILFSIVLDKKITTFSLWLGWPTVHFKDPNTEIIFDQFYIKIYSKPSCS